MHGNSKTIPRGIDIEELPFNRILRLKNANRGEIESAFRDMSSNEGKFVGEGIRFFRVCTRPLIAAECLVLARTIRGNKEIDYFRWMSSLGWRDQDPREG
jgi:hypothetical protein